MFPKNFSMHFLKRSCPTFKILCWALYFCAFLPSDFLPFCLALFSPPVYLHGLFCLPRGETDLCRCSMSCDGVGMASLLFFTARTGNKAQHEVEFWGLLPRPSPRHERQAARGTTLRGTTDHQQRPPKSACLQV